MEIALLWTLLSIFFGLVSSFLPCTTRRYALATTGYFSQSSSRSSPLESQHFLTEHSSFFVHALHGQSKRLREAAGTYVPRRKIPKITNESLSDDSESTDPKSEFQNWYNPRYPVASINSWFVGQQRALLHVGGKGVSDSHANSLRELLQQHAHVRIKVSSAKIPSTTLAQQMWNKAAIADIGELLVVKKREFLFGRRPLTA